MYAIFTNKSVKKVKQHKGLMGDAMLEEVLSGIGNSNT